MRAHQKLHRAASVWLIVVAMSCSDAVAPGGTTDPVQIPAADIMGTYRLTKVDGQPVPAVRPPSAANDFKQDTLFAGCLVLGDPADMSLTEGGNVNVTWFVSTERAAQYLRNPAYCPPFLPAYYQHYVWEGSHGTWSFCGPHACDRTDFTATVVNGAVVISAVDSALQTTYVKQ